MLRRRRVTYGGHVAQVEPGSIAEEIGIRPGDLLVSINGHPLRDVIDYQFYGAEEELELHIRRGNRVHRVQVERGYEEDLGLRFTEPLFDGLRECVNRCPFCFVAQMPRGLRRSLYVRDDDYRLSFLQGTFVTLTNLEEDDWQRIGEQHLSPLYVSIHATDLRVRRALLGNPHAPDIMAQLRRLERINITVHGQIVIVPGQNDVAILEQTVRSLLNLWHTVQSLAVVPVGLTRLCREPLRTLTPAEATDVLALVGQLEPDIRQRTGRTWLYPSDEMYLLAGVDVPGASFYDEPAQRENGVGLVRALLDDWEATIGDLKQDMFSGVRATLVCGTLIAPTLQDLAKEAGSITGARLSVLPVPNRFFGSTVTVSGLLTGQDVLDVLQARELADVVCIPRSMLDEAGERTLDDMTVDGLSQELGVPVEPVSSMSDIVDLLYSLGA